MTKKTQEVQKSESQEAVVNREPHYNYFRPRTDILETTEDLKIYMDMPGVSKDRVDIQLEKGVLSVEGKIESNGTASYTPLHREYKVGHYARRFNLSDGIDQTKIGAKLDKGVLELTLPKTPEQQPKKIAIN